MRKSNKCRTKFCRGTRTKDGKSPYCGKCRSRRWKEKHPLKYSFKNLRVRAKQRGKPFSLSFAQYEAFAKQTGYDKLKGKHSYSLSIHRIDHTKGYAMDNISAVTLTTNSRLQFANMPDWLRAEMEAEIRKGIPQPA